MTGATPAPARNGVFSPRPRVDVAPSLFRQPILMIRWGTTAMGCVLAAPEIAHGSVRYTVAVSVIVVYTLVRTILPIEDVRSLWRTGQLTAEAALIGVTVAATGYLNSPIAFSLLTAVAAAGFVDGFGSAFRLATATAAAVGIPLLVDGPADRERVQLVAQWAVELVLVAGVAGFSRRISSEAAEQERRARSELAQLGDANRLLVELHAAAQDLPASLDLKEVLDSTIERLATLISFDVGAVLLLEEADGSWWVARRTGPLRTSAFTADDLPSVVAAAVASDEVVSAVLGGARRGLALDDGHGLYRALRARDRLIGVVALERGEDPFPTDAAELLGALTDPAALAIDNARWFSRLRTVGADEERTRIARDLHDRIGQSVASLAFAVDRITRKHQRSEAIDDDLTEVAHDIRRVVGDVRDTLYDLRTDVSARRGIDEILHEFCDRVAERSGILIDLAVDAAIHPPVQQERELWRIVQEAIVNAERHSGTERLEVRWTSSPRAVTATVRDHGRGIPGGAAGRIDSYGILGMRERADAIGASLAIDSPPGGGVTVTATLRL